MSLPTVLPTADRAVLTTCVNQATATQRDVLRARIVLSGDAGPDGGHTSVRAAAARLECSRTTVIKWRARYRAGGLAGLDDLPRAGAPATYGDHERRKVVAAATADPPRPWARWTHARLAEHLADQLVQHDDQHTFHASRSPHRSPSPSWVGRALPVHTVRGWLHRKPDPAFEAPLGAIEDAVAAAHAGQRTVVCLDEKTAVPARTPCHRETRGPGSSGGVRRRELEDVRRGTLSWYGTQDVATGAVALRRSETRMDSEAFTMVLDDLVAAHGDDFTIVMDNGAAHTCIHTRCWIALHPQVSVLLTPFHASWANPVEVVFSVLTRQVINGGHLTSAEDLDDAAQEWTRQRNAHPRPVYWSWQRRGPGTSDPEH